VLIFHPYVAGVRPGDQAACWAGLEDCRKRGHWRIEDFEIAAGDKTAYARALDAMLAFGEDVTVVEHDMAIHYDQIRELEECEHPLCVFAYYVGNSWHGTVVPELAHRYMQFGEENIIPFDSRLADRVSLGVARFKAGALDHVVQRPRVPRVAYTDLAWRLSVVIDRPWHVHWPAVAHHHWNS
jgi:carbohydrate-selective porin OprB